MPRGGPRIAVADLADIVGRIKEIRRGGIGITEACKVVAEEVNKDPGTIYAIWRRLQPTVELGEVYLKSQAFRLAARVAREANVDQAIDILSRKNIGVLAPKTEEGAGQGGFFLSVNAESCGAVKIAAGAVNQLPAAPDFALYKEEAPAPKQVAAPSAPIIDVYTPEKGNHPTKRENKGQGSILARIEPSKKQASAIEAARNRLKKAQRLARRQKKQWKALGGEL